MPNQPSKVEINYDSHGVYNTGSQVKFNTMMLKSGFCGYRDAYILLSCRIKIARALASDATKKAYKNDKKITFKN